MKRWLLRSALLLLPLFLMAQMYLPPSLKDMERNHPLLKGVVLWWPILPQLIGGPKWFDIIGTNHGTLTNMGSGSGWSGSYSILAGGAVRFDGVDDTVEASHQANIAFERTNPFSIKVDYRSGNTNFQNLVRKARDSDNAGWWINMLATGQFEGGLITPTEALFKDTTTSGWNDNHDHVVVLTYDGSSTDVGLIWYIDGNVQPMSTPYATSIIDTAVTTDPLRLGTAFGASWYSGAISGLMICACTWTPVQVMALSNIKPPLYGGIFNDPVYFLGNALTGVLKRKGFVQ